MLITLCAGNFGRMKASGQEFVIVGTSASTSTIRFRYEHQTHEILDADLKEQSEGIAGWTPSTNS